MSKNETKLTAGRPSRTDRPDVDRARRDVVADDSEKVKRVPADLPISYHRRLSMIKNSSRDNVGLRYLAQEAFDDLFKKYAEGNGRYAIIDRAALERYLEDLE